MVICAKIGILNLLRSMVTNLKTNQTVDLSKTSAEIQMVKRQFGATPLIQM
jgi:hypothetical protein